MANDGMDGCLTPGLSISADCEKERRRNWWSAIANFHPGWFAVNMGTGSVAILLHDLPYHFAGLYQITVGVFVLNALLFCLFLLISIVRYALWPEKFMQMIDDPVHSLFTGTFPMGLATLVRLTVYICVPVWGQWAATLAWAIWWIDVVLSVGTCFYLPFVLHAIKLETVTAAWLLPIVATIVVSSVGGEVAEVLENDSHALLTVITSYILWGTGVPFAMVVLVIYFYRLALHKLPPRRTVVSTLLPLGPLGQGSSGIMRLGIISKSLFPRTEFLSPMAGESFYAMGTLIGLLMWGFGLIWLWFAIAALSQGPFPFNLGWWSFTFPIGVFASATILFGKEFDSVVFHILGTFLAVCVTLLWIVVSGGTVWKSITWEIFTS